MAKPNLCAFDARGRVLVVFDGREMRVHGGSDEAPLWMRTLDGDPVGVAAGDTVVSLDTSGKIRWWSVAGGEPVGEAQVSGAPVALAAARYHGACAAVVPDGAMVFAGGTPPRTVPLAGASAAAFTDDGARLAIGSQSGEVQIVATFGEPVGTCKLEEGVTSLCWSAAGFWIATSGDRVLRIPPDGGAAEHITRAGGMAPDCASASADGCMFAVRLTDDIAMALAYPSRETVVQLRYIERKVGGVAFGPAHLLGVSLVGGDGNIVDIPNEQLRRTDTFPGRTHNRWMVSTNIAPSALPPGHLGRPQGAPSPGGHPPPMAQAAPASASRLGIWLGLGATLVVIAIILSQCA
jgi:hypothetical protein